MYASATDNFAYPVRLYRLRSSDGIDWSHATPESVLEPTAGWDAGSVETPAVTFFNGKYHLFWTGYPLSPTDPDFDVTTMRIGHATSIDGVTFTVDASNPIVTPSGAAEDGNPSNDWYAFVVAEPAPVVHDGKLYLYFTALGADAALGKSSQVIGLVTSDDGTAWSEPTLALKPDQSLYPRDEDWIGYSTPNAIEIAGEMHLFFDVAHQPEGGEWLQLRLHHARSADGMGGWVHDGSPIRSCDDYPWTAREIRSPHALLDGTTLRLYFAGDSLGIDHGAFNQFGIGLLTCDLGGN
jgi:sucrose-6-phosphate hydrolase SacC (GH32 family)